MKWRERERCERFLPVEVREESRRREGRLCWGSGSVKTLSRERKCWIFLQYLLYRGVRLP